MEKLLKPVRKSPEVLMKELEECKRFLRENYLLDRQKKALEKRIEEIENELKIN